MYTPLVVLEMMRREGSLRVGSEPPVTGDTDFERLRRDRVALVLLAFAALVRICFLAEIVSHGVDLRPNFNIDCYRFDRVARRIVAGDLLERDRYEHSGRWPDEPGHPRASGAIMVVGLERYDAEYGPYAYFDFPGYDYFVAFFYAVFGPATSLVFVAQEALDLVACALVYLIGLRVYDRAAARLALGLAAANGPMLFHAGFLLRDSLIAALIVVVVYLALRTRDPGRGAATWFVTGLAYGIAWVVKGTIVLLLPFLALEALARGHGWLEGSKMTARRAAAFGAGALVAIAPFAARNVALGVPPLRMTTGDVSSLLVFNIPDGGVRGLTFDIPRARAAADRCTRLTSLEALRVAVEEHGSVFALARQSARRAAEHWIADDPWDNVRVSYLTPCLRSLALAPVRWKLIEPFAVLGMALALAAWPRRAIVLGPVALTLIVAAASSNVTRYRLSADPFHALLAASAIVWLFRAARQRRRYAFPTALGLVALSLALHDSTPPPRPRQIASYVIGTFRPETARYLLENLGADSP
jgi:hypothetical protein